MKISDITKEYHCFLWRFKILFIFGFRHLDYVILWISYTLIFMIKHLSVQGISYSESIGRNTLSPFCLGKRCFLTTLSLNVEHWVNHINYPLIFGNKCIEHYINRCRYTQTSWFNSNPTFGLCYSVMLISSNWGYTIP